MNRRFLLLVTVMVALLVLAGGAAAQDGATETTSFSESEPNDTIATADPIGFGDTTASIGSPDVVDYFRLNLQAGQHVYLAALAGCNGEASPLLAVFDAAGTLLAEAQDWPDNNIIFEFVAPATASYFVRAQVTGLPYHDFGFYRLLVRQLPADELNVPFDTPVSIQWGATIDSDNFAPYDLDYYRIHARPGDVIDVLMTVDGPVGDWSRVDIDHADDIYPYGSAAQFSGPDSTIRVRFVVPVEGDYDIRPMVALDHCEGFTYPLPYRLTIQRGSLHVGPLTAGTVNGVAFGANDILTRSASGAWALSFDGEDVGINKPLSAIEFMADGSLLLSVRESLTLPTLGKVTPFDILRFVPSTLGPTTSGSFSLYLRGKDAGLTTTGERFDAIAVLTNGNVSASSSGSGFLPRFGGGTIATRDEDMLVFHPNGSMPSAGTWELDFSSRSAIKNFSAQDIWAAATIEVDVWEEQFHNAEMLISTDRAYTYRTPFNGIYPDPKFTSARGDAIPMFFTDNDTETSVSFWPPIKLAQLGFSKPITNLSLSPAPLVTSTLTFVPTNDAYVFEGAPTDVFDEYGLKVRDAASDYNCYVKFNVQSLTGTIQSAKLWLYAVDASNDGGKVYATSPYYAGSSNQWLETGLTWANAPAILGAPLGSLGPTTSYSWVGLDVTAAVQNGLATQNGRVSFAISNDSTDLAQYNSAEGTHPPQLSIVTAP